MAGLIVGVGELRPSPIPKLDPIGRPLGYWATDEVMVMQTDPHSRGRGASVGGEPMVEEGDVAPVVGLGATPGTEHLSSLREAYLRLLAMEHGFVAPSRTEAHLASGRKARDPAEATAVRAIGLR